MITVTAQFMIYNDSFLGSDSGKKFIQREVQEGTTVGVLLEELADKYGSSFRKNIYDPEMRALNDMVMVTVNGTLLHTLKGVDTVLRQDDVIVFIPLIMGG